MNEEEIDKQLQALHERVLSKDDETNFLCDY